MSEHKCENDVFEGGKEGHLGPKFQLEGDIPQQPFLVLQN